MDIGVGIVRGYLRFTEIIAVRTAADGKQGGRLYALGNGKSCKQIPPFFQIGDKIVMCFENRFDGYRSSQFLLQTIFTVPGKNLFRCYPIPWFNKRAEEKIMVFINKGISQSFCNVLIFGKLSAWSDSKYFIRNHVFIEISVQSSAERVYLMLPKVGCSGKSAGQIAIERTVTDG